MALLEDLVKGIENNESLDGVSAPLSDFVARYTSGDAVKHLLSGGWLGHQLHPMLTDVPLGLWASASALDVLGGRRDKRAARKLVALGVLASLPTAASGAADWTDTYGPEKRVGVVHALGNAAAAALQVASWSARRRGRHGMGALLSATGLASAMGAGYLGGHLSFKLGVGVSHVAFEFPTSDWTDVAAEADLESGRPVRVDADGVSVMVVKDEGTIRALSATCVHAGGPLDEGEIDDGCVVCPWHQSRFRLSDGAVLRGPAAVAQPAWETRVRDGRVEVRAGSL